VNYSTTKFYYDDFLCFFCVEKFERKSYKDRVVCLKDIRL
jgi:hypothetical protein